MLLSAALPWSIVGAISWGARVANAQEQGTTEWCDELTDVCFQRYHDEASDMGFGYLFPTAPVGQPQPNEFVGIFTGPATAGWIGNSLGGGMRSNPLLMGWADGEGKAVVTVRIADNLESPGVMEGPQVTLLGSSGANSTHLRIVYRCQNCTDWEGGTNGIPFDRETRFGYAGHGSTKPENVTDPGSIVPQHTVAGQHPFNASDVRSPDYYEYLALLEAAPPLTPETQDPTATATSDAPTNTNPVSSCPGAPRPSFAFTTAKGWVATPVLGKLKTPRGIVLDSEGHLLVLERGIGVTGHTLDADGCVTSSKTIISDGKLNHGVDVLSNTLVASSSDVAWSWEYNPIDMTVTNKRTLVTGMDNPGHTTRTVLISRQSPDLLMVSVGSAGNIDQDSIQESSGTAQIRVFDMRTLPEGGAAYTDETHGKIMGYGIRNDVGITEDRSGNVFSVENSMDNAYRIVNGERRDIHNNNPAEKVWNLGSAASPSGLFGGYPVCYTVWDGSDFGNGDVKKQAGDWFVQDPGNVTFPDEWCGANSQSPIALLPPHTAPLDVKFGARDGDDNMYVSLHGSWNRDPPQGYKVVAIPGRYSSSGQWSPRSKISDTKNAFTDILTNRDENDCQKGCFRPVGLVFGGPNGEHMYVSSDTSGEVFLLRPGTSSASNSPNPVFALAGMTALVLLLIA